MTDTTDPDPVTEIERAREQERLHRQLQQQGQPEGDEDERPPAQRERDEAIDAATADVERVIHEAHEDKRDSAGEE